MVSCLPVAELAKGRYAIATFLAMTSVLIMQNVDSLLTVLWTHQAADTPSMGGDALKIYQSTQATIAGGVSLVMSPAT